MQLMQEMMTSAQDAPILTTAMARQRQVLAVRTLPSASAVLDFPETVNPTSVYGGESNL
jgi:hypothetical protein